MGRGYSTKFYLWSQKLLLFWLDTKSTKLTRLEINRDQKPLWRPTKLRIICRSFSNSSSEMEGVWNLYLIYHFAGQIQTYLVNKNRYRKSINIVDIIWFNPPINIDWCRKSIEIEITEIIYRLLSINKIDNNRCHNAFSSSISIVWYRKSRLIDDWYRLLFNIYYRFAD